MYTGARRVVWKTPDITADGLKLFAWAALLIHSIGVSVVEKGLIHLDQYTQESLSRAMAEDSALMFWGGVGSVMQLLGGLSVPIFAFLLVEGFRNTSNYRKYLLAVILTALVSEVPYDLAVSQSFWNGASQNALVSTAISLIMLYSLKMSGRLHAAAGMMMKAASVVAAVIWVSLFRAEFGLCMVLLTAVFYLLYDKNVWKTVLGILISLLYVTGPLSFYGIFCYNGRRTDRIPKYVYYMCYPLHLLVLGLIVTYFMA